MSQLLTPFENCTKSAVCWDKNHNLAFVSEYKKPENYNRDIQIINCTYYLFFAKSFGLR